MERIAQRGELLLAPHERRVVAPRIGRHSRQDVAEAKCHNRLRLSLQHEWLQLLDGDRVAAESSCRRGDEDLPCRGRLLEAGGDVHRVAGGRESLAAVLADQHFARRDSGPHAQPDAEIALELVVQVLDALADLDAGAKRPERVVLAREGNSEDRQDGVAEELLDPPAVALQHASDLVEVALEDTPQDLGVERLPEARGVGDVGEEHRHRLAELHVSECTRAIRARRRRSSAR